MPRKRFKLNRIASSVNYELSRKIYNRQLEINHEENKEYFKQIEDKVIPFKTSKTPYARVWGKLVEVTPEYAKNTTLKIEWL